MPNKSPGYLGNQQGSYKILHSRNIIRSLEQDLREEKSRNVVKKPHQSNYFTKILEDVDIIRGSTPPFIKNKTHLRDSGNYDEISVKQTGNILIKLMKDDLTTKEKRKSSKIENDFISSDSDN